jgi:transposase
VSGRDGRIGRQKAIVAVARKVVVAVWHVLTHERADVHAAVQAIAPTLHSFPARCGTISGKRRSQVALLRKYLQQLGVGEAVQEVRYSGRVSRLWVVHRDGEAP